MTIDAYSCLCCSPFFADLFKSNASISEIADEWARSSHATNWFQSGAPLNRRDFVRGGAAFAGTASLIPASAHAQSTVTRLFTGGTILTVNKDFSEAQAIAIRGNKILAVGSDADVKKAAGSDARIVDLKGRVMLPGFIDAHSHVVTGSMVDALMDFIGIAKFTKTADALTHLRETAAKSKPGEWIMARNWDPSVQEGPDQLTFKELDAVSDKHPIFILNASGHIAYSNSKAFEAAKIAQDIKNPPGAEWSRDTDGNLNGVMKNMATFINILQANPALAALKPADALVALLDKWAPFGLTTTSELALGTLSNGVGDWEILKAAAATGKLKARIRAYPQYLFEKKWSELRVKPGDGDALVRMVGYKLIADGSNQGFTGLQREPYLGTDNHGIAYTEPAELKRLALDRAKEGWQLAIHGNGDKGIDNVLDAVQAVKDAGHELAKLRPRIEHCSILHDEQIARMKELGVSASFLIGHVHFWGVAMRDTIFGEAKAKLLDRCRSAEEAGVGYTLHSDFMVTDPDPLHMIEMAVTRRLAVEPNYVLAADETIPVESAIRALTSEAAWQLYSEHEVGSLEVGKFADMVILEKDPRKVDPNTIKSIKVLETWMDGKQVFVA